jgi:Fe-S oxidoreductase
MTEEINPLAIMDSLGARVGARFRVWLNICTHCGLCADTCHYYLSHDNDPEMIPSYKVRFLKEILKKKGKVDKVYLDKVYQAVYHECNMCRRCTMYCPFGIDMALMIGLLRELLCSQGRAPERLSMAIENYKTFGNQMGITKDEWLETLEWCEEEAAEELVGLKIPIDKKGAKIMYTLNPREVQSFPLDIMEVAKIFHVAGEDWTVPSEKGWDMTNLAMFAGDLTIAKMIVENTFKRAEELGVEQIVLSE